MTVIQNDYKAATHNEALSRLEPHEIKAITAAALSLRNDLSAEINILLFGSRAIRTHRSNSDYDMLCIIPDNLPQDSDWDQITERAERAMSTAISEAEAHIQIIAESSLEYAYFEFAFIPSALRDGIDLAKLYKC